MRKLKHPQIFGAAATVEGSDLAIVWRYLGALQKRLGVSVPVRFLVKGLKRHYAQAGFWSLCG